MAWERQKRRMAEMSPEELAAFKEKRRQQQRDTYNRRMAKERAAGIRPPAVKGRPRPTKVQIAAAEAERAAKRAEAKRVHRSNTSIEEMNQFLAQGAQERGFSAFLRSKEIRLADQLTTPFRDRESERKAAA